MRVRAVQGFTDENGRHEVGAELELAPFVAVIRIRDGLCVPVHQEAPETAVLPDHTEKAMRRAPKPPRRAPKVARGK